MKILISLFAMAAMAVANNEELIKQFQDGNYVFTTKMFEEVTKSNPGKSVVLSPFSVLTPLAQLSLAAVGESHDELLRSLGLPNDNVIRAVFPLINVKVRDVKGVELKSANKIYIPTDYELNEAFAADSKSVFGSEVKNVDFSNNKETAAEVNAWVEDQTNHRIKDLVDPNSLSDLTRALLVSAIYFKGSWEEKFFDGKTIPRDFHVTKDKTTQIPTMYKSGYFQYVISNELDAKIISLPYKGNETHLLVILPNEIDGLPGLQEKLKDPALLEKAINGMARTAGSIYLPKFKIETTTNLKDVLKKIGVNAIFDELNANLKNLLKTKEKLYVSDAIQKAFIEVNEEGSEAAAGNRIGITPRILPSVPLVEFNADHPFIFALRQSNIDLFVGNFVPAIQD